MRLMRELFSMFCASLMYIIILTKTIIAVAFIQQMPIAEEAYIGCWCRKAGNVLALWELSV